MSVELAILIVALMMAIYFFRVRRAAPVAELTACAAPPQPACGLEPPEGYCCHPGHLWMMARGRDTARIGIDAFAASLLGKVERIGVIGEQRWVRQGQKLITLLGDDDVIEMLSPLEGVVAAINVNVIKNPELLAADPYGEGWVCVIKSQEMEINRRNLVPSASTSGWMGHCVQRLKKMLAEAEPALAQDGGLPGRGVLHRLPPELRRRVVNEFFLT